MTTGRIKGILPNAAGKGLSFFKFRPCLLIFLAMAGIVYLTAQEEWEAPREESKFTFGRVFFETGMGRFFSGRFGRGGGPLWSHDWPRAEEHLMKILAEVTRLDVNPGGHIISFQDDDCFKYPIAYLCEVGSLELSDEEAVRMSEYLLRGGFLIVDDFRGEGELANFRAQMRRVFPDRSLETVPKTHPIWTSFFDISDLKIEPPYWEYLIPQYFGISDDSDRLMMIVDYNNDISEYWEWSDDPMSPIESTNEAYKYGVNYVMYALTH
ncbi:MAG: DUF4159 domain-containing protein [Acidobacteriota bacterium]